MPIVGIIIFSIIALIILILIVRNIKIVPQAHAFVIERLGAYHTTWETGLHLKVPFIVTSSTSPWRRTISSFSLISAGPTPCIAYTPLSQQ